MYEYFLPVSEESRSDGRRSAQSMEGKLEAFDRNCIIKIDNLFDKTVAKRHL